MSATEFVGKRVFITGGSKGVGEAIVRRFTPETVDAMRAFNLKTIAAGHCTGGRAIGALTSVFGHAVVPSAVGKTFRL